MKRLILTCLLGGVLSTSTGCGLLQAIFCYRPCGMRNDCGPGVGGDGYDGSCGPVRTAHRARIAADCGSDCDVGCGRSGCRTCGSCDPCADPCGSGSCGRVWHRGPLSCVFALFAPGRWCGGGCGERYWGDFYGDPPDCWDPCDGQGNYTGGGGCRTCGGGNGRIPAGNVYDDGEGVPQGNIISQTDRAVGPAQQPHRAARPQ